MQMCRKHTVQHRDTEPWAFCPTWSGSTLILVQHLWPYRLKRYIDNCHEFSSFSLSCENVLTFLAIHENKENLKANDCLSDITGHCFQTIEQVGQELSSNHQRVLYLSPYWFRDVTTAGCSYNRLWHWHWTTGYQSWTWSVFFDQFLV